METINKDRTEEIPDLKDPDFTKDDPQDFSNGSGIEQGL